MIPGAYYQSVFLYVVLAISIYVASCCSGKGFKAIARRDGSFTFALLLSLILAVFLGQRPISGFYFGDTSNYARTYRLLQAGFSFGGIEDEWLWEKFMQLCAPVMDVSAFFTLVDLGYFGLTLWASNRLFKNKPLAALLFNLGALSFYTYGTNGIRNGLACAGVLLYLSYIVGDKREKIIAGCLAFFIVAIHKTTILPIGMSLAALFVVKKFKQAYVFWILSIFISLAAGGAVTAIFAGMGFDDRLSYLTSEADKDLFSSTGFRWDFLIYSMMPIVLGYYVVVKRGIRDATYELLLNTYTLSNAFWVMVIKANYSNRFAYLSWFMYPMVLAYPLLKLNVWGEAQGKYLSRIMLANVGFTWFMQTLYW